MVIMAFLASEPARLFQAREVSLHTQVSLPTVSKLLKKLTKHKLLVSERGSQGGYYLALSPKDITIADLVQLFEGPIAITECNLGHDQCVTESLCTLRTPWLTINQAITNALKTVKLSDLANAANGLHEPSQVGRYYVNVR